MVDTEAFQPKNPIMDHVPDIDAIIHPAIGASGWTANKYTAKQIGGYAWSIYGLLIMMNMRYYYDLYYRTYIMSPYGENGRGVAFRDIWGVAAFLRIAIHMAAWSIAGLFWIWCFLP